MNQNKEMDKSKLIAHIAEDGRIQTMDEHLNGVAELASQYACAFGEPDFGEFLGKYHDIGKYSKEFQAYIRKEKRHSEHIDHSTAGAYECMRNAKSDKPDMLMAAMVIAGHHAGLLDASVGVAAANPGDGSFFGRLKKAQRNQIPDYKINWKASMQVPPKDMDYDEKDPNFGMNLFIKEKLLFSSLVDGDYTDTSDFMNPEFNSTEQCASMCDLLNMAAKEKSKFGTCSGKLNQTRMKILNACEKHGHWKRGLYSLTVPTGGGKTFSSMMFALYHAVEHHMDRIIYVIPYTSIIEQNAAYFRGVFGENNVLESHSNVDLTGLSDTEMEKLRLLSETWKKPIVVTTAVQFFESLFSNRPSKSRKLHNMANAVIIFDEVQMLPPNQLFACLSAVSALVKVVTSTCVFCTATYPALNEILAKKMGISEVKEIAPNIDFKIFDRTIFVSDGLLTVEDVVERMKQEPSVLTIVNSRKSVRKIYDLLVKEAEGVYGLTTLLTSVDRTRLLDEIRYRLEQHKPCRVVSTSLIECGVDVDFAHVMREFAGLDAMTQAAGRCNREGKRPKAESLVTVFTLDGSSSSHIRLNVKAAVNTVNADFSQYDEKSMQRYFELLFYLKGNNELDSKEVYRHISKQCFAWDFPEIARNFHMIENQTKTIYIPNDDCQEEIDALMYGKPNLVMMRKLGQHCVNVYESDFRDLCDNGELKMINEDVAVLQNTKSYDSRVGLSLGEKAYDDCYLI